MNLSTVNSEIIDKTSREDESSFEFIQAVESNSELQRRKQRMLKRRDEIRDTYLSSLAFEVMEGML